MQRARRNTVGDALRRAARVHRDATALSFADRTWSFAELDHAANRVAQRFAEAGLQPGDRIACYGRNSDAYFLAWLGCVRGGFVHVPVNYALAGEELAYIVRQSGARAVIAAASLEANLAGIDVELRGRFEGGGALDVLEAAQADTAPPEIDPPLDDESLAQIVYTSGTTAAPKGAMMTHRAMMAQYFSCIHNMEYAATDRDHRARGHSTPMARRRSRRSPPSCVRRDTMRAPRPAAARY